MGSSCNAATNKKEGDFSRRASELNHDEKRMQPNCTAEINSGFLKKSQANAKDIDSNTSFKSTSNHLIYINILAKYFDAQLMNNSVKIDIPTTTTQIKLRPSLNRKDEGLTLTRRKAEKLKTLIIEEDENIERKESIAKDQFSLLKEPPYQDLGRIPLLPDKHIRLLEVLGEGSFGKVFKAYDNREGCKGFKADKFLALKFLKNMHNISDILAEDFVMNEIKKLGNEGFLEYDGLYRDPKNEKGLILAMETGKVNLKNLLNLTNPKLEENEIFYILDSLINNLCVLQQNGIVNRDIKPENIILIEKSNGDYIFKLADFGCSCILEKKENYFISIDELFAFSRYFAAPEVLEIANDIYAAPYYDPFKSDVYSLAISVLDMFNSNLNEFASLKFKCVDLKNILMEMLEIDPKKRISFFDLRKKITAIRRNYKIDNKFFQNKVKMMIKEWDKFKQEEEEKLSLADFLDINLIGFQGYYEIRRLRIAEEKFINKIEKKIEQLIIQKVVGNLGDTDLLTETVIKITEFYLRQNASEIDYSDEVDLVEKIDKKLELFLNFLTENYGLNPYFEEKLINLTIQISNFALQKGYTDLNNKYSQWNINKYMELPNKNPEEIGQIYKKYAYAHLANQNFEMARNFADLSFNQFKIIQKDANQYFNIDDFKQNLLKESEKKIKTEQQIESSEKHPEKMKERLIMSEKMLIKENPNKNEKDSLISKLTQENELLKMEMEKGEVIQNQLEEEIKKFKTVIQREQLTNHELTVQLEILKLEMEKSKSPSRTEKQLHKSIY